MIKRISVSRFQSAHITFKFFFVRRVARYVFFIDAVISHQAPFIMVSAQPQLKKIGKRFVLFNDLFRQMTMIVENRHILRAIEKSFRRFVR